MNKLQNIQNIRRDDRGFTLAEVMITIVIMGILAGIAIPSWFSVVNSRRVDSATNQVLADLRLAHNQASNRLTTVRLRFSSTGAPVTCNGVAADYCLIRGTTETPRNLDDNVVLNSPNLLPISSVSAVDFSSDGSATAVGTLGSVSGITDSCPVSTPSGPPRLQITVDGNPTHCLTFNIYTSRVRID